MKPILIIKTGSTLEDLRKRKGDFEDWIIKGSGLSKNVFLVVDVEHGEKLPPHKNVSAVFITGSHAMVTEHLEWSELTAKWLVGAINDGVPTLGICYGHQLLAHALGGTVAYNPKGREMGTVEIKFNAQVSSDPLLKILPKNPRLHVCHSQTVTNLPPGAVHLAVSDKDTNQAFSFNGNTWGVQFHPEFDADITRTYIQSNSSQLKDEGQDPQQCLDSCLDSPLGDQVIKQFVFLAAGY